MSHRPAFAGRLAAVSLAFVTLFGVGQSRGDDEGSAVKPAESPPSHREYRVLAALETATYYDTDHTAVVSPTIAATVENPTAGWSIGGRYLVDVVSAASVDVVSTASKRWNEVRTAGSLAANYKPGNFGVGLTGGYSFEPDYHSYSGGITTNVDFDQKNRNLLLGYSHGRDTIGRHFTPFSIYSHTLDKNAFNAGLTFVIDRSTLFALVGDAIYERGDQSKPYRYIPMFTPGSYKTLAAGASIDEVNAARLSEKPLEQLPLARDRYAITGRIAKRYDASTLRVSERVYADTWGLKASTTDLQWLVDVSESIIVWPHLRLHAQNSVTFWKRVYEVTFQPGGAWTFPALRTGDRELSALTTATLGGGMRWSIGPALKRDEWVLTFQVDANWTHFFDALFIKDRLSTLAIVGIAAEL